jgi:hypothetical protein
MRSILFAIFAVIASLIATLVVVEVAVRFISPQEVGPVRFACAPGLGAIPVPLQQGERRSPGVFAFRYRNNSLGWRGGREYREQKQAAYRVLFLGDSFTYGLGVNDDETFAARLEQRLTADLLPVEAMNAGCPGKGSDYALKSFQLVGRKFHPDLVVLGFFGNDFQDNERGEYYNIDNRGRLQAKPLDCRESRLKTWLHRLPGYNWLLGWSQAANLVKETAVRLLVARAAKTEPQAAQGLVVAYNRGDGGYANAGNKQATGVYLEHLKNAVKQAGGELIVFYIPDAREVTGYRRTMALSADELAVRRLAADNGIGLWSLTPLLAHSGQTIEGLYYREGHWTAAAHELAARHLSRLVQESLARRRNPDKTGE